MKEAKVLEKNIEKLTKSKDDFISYVDKSYDRDNDFPKSSFYFHKKVIDMIRASKHYGELFNNDLFLEFVYATLSTWGLDRMDGSARLVDFDYFRKSILDNSSILAELSVYKMSELIDSKRKEINDKISDLFDSLKIMARDVKLVGASKALHHLLPDLVPPIDRKYTLNFFYGDTNYNKDNQKNKFFEIFDKFCFISKKLHLDQKDLTREWDTSIPKLIDNAIIGFGS